MVWRGKAMFEAEKKEVIVTLEEMVDILVDSTSEQEPFDFGGNRCHRVIHSTYGKIVLIETPNSKECLVIKM